MPETQIFVITHKKVKVPDIPGSSLLMVGAWDKGDIEEEYCRDDTGDNISQKNGQYCELTGMYWIWKNALSEVVGICHYRRFLTNSLFSKKSRYFVTGEQARAILKDYDMILPRKVVFQKTVGEMIRYAPNRSDMDELRAILLEKHPDYITSYDWYMNQNKTYWYNIMITREEIYSSYCSWLFDILEEFEKRHDMSLEKGYRVRLIGTLSERLLNVWVKKNITSEKIKEFHMVKTEERGNPFTDYLKNVAKNVQFCLFQGGRK